MAGISLWCDVSTGFWWLVLMASFHYRAFLLVHGLYYTSVKATPKLLNSHYMWPSLAACVKAWCWACQGCSTGKTAIQETTSVEKIPIPAARFSHVHVDLVGPLPVTARGNHFLLTMMDWSTHLPEVVSLKAVPSMEAALEVFLESWVARFSAMVITTDRGTQFNSATWATWCVEYGIRHIQTTTYQPQSKGMVERVLQQLRDALRARATGAAWDDQGFSGPPGHPE